jgi:two-component system response regulator TtrR
MMNSNNQHIFLVDDEANVLQVTAGTLEQLGVRVSCFANAAVCLEHLRSRTCDLLIADLKMPEMGGIELLRHARLVAPSLPILIITGYGDVPMAVEAIKAGAVDCIEKPLDKKSFVEKIQSILRKNGNHIDAHAEEPLTVSEKRVLRLVIDGKSSNEIANLLNRSKRTIEVHRARVMRKLGVDNLIDLVKRTAAMGLVELQASEELPSLPCGGAQE